MTRIALILCLVVCAAGSARAESSRERLLAALEADGYDIQQVERTWLGRLRIVATKGDLRREVVINPGTGEVLRDIASSEDAEEITPESAGAVASTGPARPGFADTGAGVTAEINEAASSVAPESGGLVQDGVTTSGAPDTSADVLLPEAGVTQ